MADPLNDRAARVFEFLVELQRLRTRVVRSLDAYRTVLWFADLPTNAGVQTAQDTAESGVWLAVDRVEREVPPTPPVELRPWLTDRALRDSSQSIPALSARTVRVVDVVTPDGDQETATEELLLQDHPEVAERLDAWAPVWQAWAEDDRPRAATAEIYHLLYAMYQDSRALAETYEVVMAFGCLITRSGGQDVRRHLVTAATTIELDLETGRLTVLPSPDGSTASLEQDMLEPEDTVPDQTREAIRAGLNELDDPWEADPEGVAGLLRTWVNGSGSETSYASALKPPLGRGASESPTVTFAPALVLRERTRRSFVAACEHIIAALRAGAPVPTGVRQFAEITDGKVPADKQQRWIQSYADEETYFPKPANAEQRQIRDRLSDHQTVVVQGPPGTGKTHTIANLISDLLAHGQRVLITSTTTRALKVLKDKIPAEISDLCVSVTDDAIKGQADLERSVSTILTQADVWNQEAADREATLLRQRLADARARTSQALAELRSIREQETYRYSPDVGIYQGTLQDIATQLTAEEPALGWLGPVPTDHPSITVGDAERFLWLLRQATPERRALAGRTPDMSTLLKPEVYDELAERRRELLERAQELADVPATSEYEALGNLGPTEREQVRIALANLERRRKQLERRREPWVAEALEDVLGGRERTWRRRHQSTSTGLSQAENQLASIEGHAVTGLERLNATEALGHVSAVVDHLTAGGKLKGVFGRTKVAKDAAPFLDQAFIDGRRCAELNQAQAAQAHLQVEIILQQLEDTWGYPNQHAHNHPHRLAMLQDEAQVLAAVLSFADASSAIEQRMHNLPRMPAIDLSRSEDLTRLERTLAALALAELQTETQTQVDPAQRLMRNLAREPASIEPVRHASRALNEWDADGYRAAFAGLQRAREANELLSLVATSHQLVSGNLPSLAQALEAAPEDPLWDQRLQGLNDAWAWSVWDERLRAKTDPRAEEHWRQVLSVAEVDERSALQQLASNRGWSHCLQRLSPNESTHLKMYAQAIRKAGKGTGKYAARYREDARASLRACQSAVPAWIMPMHQVFETVPVDRPNLFDVVVVDEASQSGLEGLLLSWLAPRMVVVGDDKQVSPSNVGLDHESVFTLQDRYLAPLEHKSLFGPLSSFFDQAVSMSASKIMLREHFRCMPEIIGFSNELCYRGELVPLRQYGADRLPPLRTTFVKGAIVAGRRDVVNEAETEALVAQIEKCCADPQYDGMSMGVITLLGNAQDKLITQRLVDALGVRVVEERSLRVGNAEAFQGDERDVIFISMVSSLQSTVGPARIGPLSKESDQQRLNVAASRARDQVWLFHSVHPGDLSAKDLRQRYLQYLLKPSIDQDTLDIGEVLSHQRHPSFDSLFEQRVFLALRERGYRVRPQLKVGGYRIDLVVEGGSRRLAVECDGDAFHSGEAQIDDAARQRDLERVGWTFWRVRGSTFFRDPTAAMEPLWELLERLDIQPSWIEPKVEEPVTTHTEVQAAPAPAAEPTDDPTAHTDTSTNVMLDPDPTRAVTAQPSPAAEPRFRGGKVLLTSAAHRRVQQEAQAVEAWLASPPPVHGVDARSWDAQRAKRESQVDDLEGRLHYLRRVLSQSLVDPSHRGGQWVTPGCVVGLRFASDEGPERHLVTSLPPIETADLDLAHVSPFTDLARAIDGAEVGTTIQYETPQGLQQADISEIVD